MTPLQPVGNSADELQAEFRTLYRAPGARNLGVVGLFAGFGPLAFYLVDAISSEQPWIGGAQTLRLSLVVPYLALSALCWLRPQVATRNYAWLFGATCIVFMTVACAASYIRHKDESLPEILRGLDVTLILSTVVMFGFSRLSARWTAMIVGISIAETLIFLVVYEAPSVAQMSRVILQLFIVGVCCFLLRRGSSGASGASFSLPRRTCVATSTRQSSSARSLPRRKPMPPSRGSSPI